VYAPRTGQYRRVGNSKAFDGLLERKSPELGSKSYRLITIHDLKAMGWTKAWELLKVARA